MFNYTDISTVELSLPTQIGFERVAMACSAAFARYVGFLPERIEDLKTAVCEACLNAIEHGNKGKPDARVIITMTYDGEAINVYVKDQGDGIKDIPDDPDIEKKLLHLEAPRGLGMFLIRQLVDEFEFNILSDDGHTVRIQIKGGPEVESYQAST
ncbi:MAG: ATP-binding protein [Deltaproteobacteria bacterium]|nr:MAG: ATP-binding protein [Deltaproteobacteria bacterium]